MAAVDPSFDGNTTDSNNTGIASKRINVKNRNKHNLYEVTINIPFIVIRIC